MVSAVGPGSATASFGRDGRNRDVKRTIDGVTTYLIYDGWNLVAEYNAAGTLTTQYIHGPRVDEILAKVTPTSTTFPLPDALGSTIAVTDASGAVLERVYYFDAFGTPTFRSGTGVQLPDTSTGTRFLFTGREWFARLGLYDYRNRTYSPRLGRFVQADPIGFVADDVNLYRYCNNSPITFIDPSGKAWIFQGLVTVGIITYALYEYMYHCSEGIREAEDGAQKREKLHESINPDGDIDDIKRQMEDSKNKDLDALKAAAEAAVSAPNTSLSGPAPAPTTDEEAAAELAAEAYKQTLPR
jgi:RHS repeat-associated protein